LARYRDGEAAYFAYADDYCFFIWGLLEMYEATFAPEYLRMAAELNSDLLRFFWDQGRGGLFFYGSDAEQQVLRPKEFYDGATPAANSVAASNFARLAIYSGDEELEEKSHRLLTLAARQANGYPTGYTALLSAAIYHLYGSREIVIVGDRAGEDASDMIRSINERFLPNAVTIFCPSEPDQEDELFALNQSLRNYKPVAGRATAYVCRNHACLAPVTSLEELDQILN
jgi:uncharacterized protein YyaL (SSP411 family)